MEPFKPWAKGPFELLRHAEGHFKQGDDIDKRIAMISFDNALEVSITAFLQLHPRQRNGKTYNKTKIEEWLSNYYNKILFFWEYISEMDIPEKVGIDEIIFYHRVRNELYHAGNGVVPCIDSLEGIRTAAIWVFESLFYINPEPYFESDVPKLKPIEQKDYMKFTSPSTRFLQNFIEFESLYSVIKENDDFFEQENLPKNWFSDVRSIRNEIVHGNPVNFDKLEKIENELVKKNAELKARIINYQSNVKRKYSGKYKKLGDYLLNSGQNMIILTYVNIEDIIGTSLPKSAYHYIQWWRGGHNQELAWREVGYNISEIKLGKSVTFSKSRPNMLYL